MILRSTDKPNKGTDMITLSTPGHGTYTADAKVLDRALAATQFRSLALLRSQAAGCCGHPDYDWIAGEAGAFDDLTRVEVLIAWIDSGNHTF